MKANFRKIERSATEDDIPCCDLCENGSWERVPCRCGSCPREFYCKVQGEYIEEPSSHICDDIIPEEE